MPERFKTRNIRNVGILKKSCELFRIREDFKSPTKNENFGNGGRKLEKISNQKFFGKSFSFRPGF